MKHKSDSFLIRFTSIFAVGVASSLIIAKAVVFWFSGSLAILGSLTDSALDLLSSTINLLAIRWALIPADDDHRFGHGKAEALAGLFQAALMLISMAVLMTESVSRLFHPQEIQHSLLGFWVSFFSFVMTGFLVLWQGYVVKKTGNLVIKSDRLHYQSDLMMNLTLMIAFAVQNFMPTSWLDPILSIGIALLIGNGAKDIVLESINQLMDKELSDEQRAEIFKIATLHSDVKEIHDLRTRQSGGNLFIQFHLELDPNMPLWKAHIISEAVEAELQKHYPRAEIFIHQDPVGLPQENPVQLS